MSDSVEKDLSMGDAPTLTLIVIRVADIHQSAIFYAAIGFTFDREQHGKGPVHYSTRIGDAVFELYPASERFPVTTTRLGFEVVSIEAVLERWRQNGCEVPGETQESQWGPRRVIVTDLDGHRVELTQKTTG